MTRKKEHSTARAEAEEVRRDDERFRALADMAPAMLWVTEPDGRVSFLSRSWQEFTGQDEEAASGNGWIDAIHPDDRSVAGALFAQATAVREPVVLEYRLRRR